MAKKLKPQIRFQLSFLYFRRMKDEKYPMLVVTNAVRVLTRPQGSVGLIMCAQGTTDKSTSRPKLHSGLIQRHPISSDLQTIRKQQRPEKTKQKIATRTLYLPKAAAMCRAETSAQQIASLWSTPKILTSLKLKLASCSYNKNPIRNIIAERNSGRTVGFGPFTDRGIASPIMNRKAGNMRSAGVSPFHLAWFKNQKPSRIWLSTMIMAEITMPLQTSIDWILGLGVYSSLDQILSQVFNIKLKQK